jgi:hypothetical protein
MSRKGHYNGGGTLVGRQNASWFSRAQHKAIYWPTGALPYKS